MTPTTLLITGASSGLGAALALGYAAPGIILFLTGRHQERLEAIADQCKAKGAIVYAHSLDITHTENVRQWILECDANHPIDMVIANAGISGGTAGGTESEEQTRRIFQVNVDGVFNSVLPLIPHMQRRKAGHIVLISSLASYRGLPSAPAYSASKAAIRVYGEALRGALHADNVAVTVVTPGYIVTPMTAVNDFPMPGIMPVERAVTLLQKKLARRPARLAFPWFMYGVVWLLMLLPPQWTDPLFRLLPKKK